SFLGQFISRRTLEDAYASSLIAPFAEKTSVGYFVNIKVLMDADDRSQHRVRAAAPAFLVAFLVLSWVLGLWYLVITITVFFVCAAAPIAEAAQSNALQHVLAIALILDRWRHESIGECEHWIEQASSLRPLYNVVQGADRRMIPAPNVIAGILIGVINDSWRTLLGATAIWPLVFCVYVSVVDRSRMTATVASLTERGRHLLASSPVLTFYAIEFATALSTALPVALLTHAAKGVIS
ncbi:MAG: hypothetical protein ACRDL7_07415, partial [Gaiellaceae bacterium]